MTKFRKMLSILLSICLVVSIFTTMGISASADEADRGAVTNVELNNGEAKTVCENSGGEWRDGKDDRMYYYYYIPINEGDNLTLTYENGERVDYLCCWDDEKRTHRFDSYDEESLFEGEDIFFGENQYEEPWELGQNSFTISYGDGVYTSYVDVIENPVEDVRFITERQLTVYKDLSGEFQTDGDGNEYFRYDTRWFEEGDCLSVTYKDDRGTLNYYFMRNEDGEFFVNNEYEDTIDAHKVNYNDRQEENHWTGTGEYNVEISYLGFSDSFPVTVTETPVKSFEYIPARPFGAYEGTQGRWNVDENGFEFFEYDVHPDDGDRLIVNFKDVEEPVEYNCSWDENAFTHVFRCEGDYMNLSENGEIFFYADQPSKNWTVGSNSFEISCCGVRIDAEFVVKECPITDFTYVSRNQEPHYVNGEGDTRQDAFGEDYFEYNIPVYDGDIICVTNKDNTESEYVCRWDDKLRTHVFENGEDALVEGTDICYEHDQYNSHWQLGDNYYMMYCMGFGKQMTYTLTENPVSSISFSSDFPRTIYKDLSGNYDTDRDGNEFFRYDTRWFEEGDCLSVTYKDGRGTVDYYFTRNNDGEFFESYSSDNPPIDAHSVNYNDRQEDEHWTQAGEYNIEISYLGFTADLPITVIETPVESFEYTPVHPFSSYENAQGRWERDDNGKDFFNYDVHPEDGDVLVVTYKDREEPVTYTCEWFEETRTHVFRAMSGDEIMLAENREVMFEDNQNSDHWSVGSNPFTITCMGVPVEMNYEVKESEIRGFEYISRENRPHYEGVDGEWRVDGSGYEFFEYYIPIYNGDIVRVLNKDESTTDYVCGWDEKLRTHVYENSNGDRLIEGQDIIFNHEQNRVPWKVGDNPYEINCMGVSLEMTYTLLANPVDSISFTAGISRVFYKDKSGKFETDRDGNEYFRYDTGWFENGDVLSVTYNDGRGKVDYTFVRDDNGEFFVSNVADNAPIDAHDVEFNDWQDDVHWTQTGSYSISVSYLGANADFTASVVDSPVAEISYTPANAAEAFEYTNGMYLAENDNPFFEYWFPMCDGDVITVTYNDDRGTVDYTCRYDEELEGNIFVSEGGDVLTDREDIRVESNQFEQPWGVGEHSFTLTVLGASVDVPFTVVQCPTSGTSGSCSWSYDYKTRSLVISGEGDMIDYDWEVVVAPWLKYEIDSVTIGDGVTGIGAYAFNGCRASSFRLGAGVKTIGEGAFNNCSEFNQLELPAFVERIGNCAFMGCPFISVFVPSTVVFIGENALGYYYDFENDKVGKYTNLKISGFEGSTAEVYAWENLFEFTAIQPVTEPVTDVPVTVAPITEAPTTEAPTTEAPTTEAPTTEAPTTEAPTTEAPTTEAPTTEAPTTAEPTTEAPTTEAPTTEAPTTAEPTTEAPTTEAPTTAEPTTVAPTTAEPTTEPTTEAPKPEKIKISKAKITVNSATYTGKALKPKVVVKYKGKTLKENTDYKVAYSNNTKAGKGKVTITGCRKYTGNLTKQFTIRKASQKPKITVSKKTLKERDLKKQAKTIAPISVRSFNGTIKFTGTSSSNKLTINSKTGKITVKKGTSKRKYTMNVIVSINGGTNYKSFKKSYSVTVTVK